MKTISQNNSSGFTLVELLVAMVLLAIGILSTVSMIITALNANTLANKLTVKTTLAQTVMEDILSGKVTDTRLNSTTAPVAYDLESTTTGNNIIVKGAGTFHAEYEVTRDTPISGVSQIVVRTTDVTPGVVNPSVVTLTGYARLQ